MSNITSLNQLDSGATSRTTINTNFTNLNNDKVESASPTFTGTVTLPTGLTGIAKLTSGVVSAVTAPSGAIVGDTDTQTLSAKTLTAPKIADAGFIADNNGNEQLLFHTTASAVNQVEITNAITGTAGPLIQPGGESNIDLKVAGKGTGKVHRTSSVYGDITAYTPTGGGTATLTLNTSNIHTITMPAGNITIALSNEAVGQCFIINIIQDSGGSRSVTWFTTIKWAGGSAPTLTTTGNKIDTVGFIVSSAGNYYGYVVGQNL